MAELAKKAGRPRKAAEPVAPTAAPVAVPARRSVVAQPEPTETGSVTYNPAPGDPDVTVIFGKTFYAGKSVTVDDPRHFQKLRNHPQFSTGGRKAAASEDPGAKELDRARDKAGAAAREARVTADEAVAEAEAKERAQQALAALESAKVDPDRDPPVTNYPVNR